jgi:hypothetical protein
MFMSNAIPLRSWATPLTIGAFFLLSTTGLLMFFGWDRGLMSGVHQWLSWLFLAGVGGHVAANIRPFKNHCKSRWGKVTIATFTIVLAASFFSWGIATGHHLLKAVEQALVDAPLSTLASLTHTAPDALVRRLKAHGIIATSQQTVRDLSSERGESKKHLLAIVFLTE